MVPKGVAVSDGVLLMLGLYNNLPFTIQGATQVDLQETCGTILRKVPRLIDSGNTVYDADGNLITMDGRVMRGNEVSDATRRPGIVNETNFLKQLGLNERQLWFSRIFNGADDPDPRKEPPLRRIGSQNTCLMLKIMMASTRMFIAWKEPRGICTNGTIQQSLIVVDCH